MEESKTIAVNADHSNEGYVTIKVEQWYEILDILIEAGTTVKFLYEEDHPVDGC